MKKNTLMLLLFMLLILQAPCLAKGLIGTNYAAGLYSHIDYGDGDNDYLNNGNGATAVCNFNRDSDTDVKLTVHYQWTDGTNLGQDVDMTTLGFNLDGIHVFNESEHMKPYVSIGIRVLDIDVTGPGKTAEDSDIGLGFGIGVEFELGEQLFANVGLDHDNVGDDATYFGVTGGCWLGSKLVALAGISRELDHDATLFTVGGGFTF